MNIFKRFIPKANAQTVQEVESFTLTWKIQGNGYGEEKVKHKVFIYKKDAEEYETQLNEAAKFLGTWVRISIDKN